MCGIEERPEEHHRDGVHAQIVKVVHRLQQSRLIERRDDSTRGVDTLRDAAHAALHEQRLRLVPGSHVVVQLLRQSFRAREDAAYPHRVLVTLRRDEAHPGPTPGHDTVDEARRAQREHARFRKHGIDVRVQPIADVGKRGDDALSQVGRRREGLVHPDAALVVHDHAIGERTSHVYANDAPHETATHPIRRGCRRAPRGRAPAASWRPRAVPGSYPPRTRGG